MTMPTGGLLNYNGGTYNPYLQNPQSQYLPQTSGLSQAQTDYMNQNYAGKWDPAFWTPQQFATSFPNWTADGSTKTPGPNDGPYPVANAYTGDITKYGTSGGEHMWLTGANGQPYGLQAYKPLPTQPSQQSIDQMIAQALAQYGYGQNGNWLANFQSGGGSDGGAADGDSGY